VTNGLVAALVGSMVTLTLSLGAAIFRMGHHSARIEELEKWRATIRLDMHEISTQLGLVGQELKRLATLIEERTHRHRDEDGRR
jgi:uncharacterized protein (UPF0335 family)